MKKKHFLFATVLVSVALVFSIGSLQPVSAEPIIIKYADGGSPKLSRSKAVIDTMNEIEKRTGGRVKHEAYWSQSLLKARDILRGVGMGTAGVGYPIAIIMHHKRFPLWQFAQLLYTGGPDQYAVSAAETELYDINPTLKKEWDDQNVNVLTFNATTPTLLVSKKPLRVSEDFKGTRLRTLGTAAQFVAAMGGTPVSMPIYETSEALARGVIDGCQAYLYTVYTYKMYESCKAICMDGISHLETEYVINKDLFAKMPPDVQKIYVDTWRGFFLDRLVKYTEEDREMHVKAFKEAGVDMYTLTPEQLATWKRIGEKVNEDFYYKKMEEKGIDGKKIASQYQALYDKYERK